MTIDSLLRLMSYLLNASYTGAMARLNAHGSYRLPTAAMVVGTLSNDWLVEIEAVGGAEVVIGGVIHRVPQFNSQ
jgi:enamine deaminase RidA (YjgF/YER057c/UK114 family)